MIRKILSVISVCALAVGLSLAAAVAAPPLVQLSGAIFTSDASGVPVNLNHYADKRDVYLNGGPGINAPADAAGLPPGVYAFQVTSPSGKALLSTDPVECRRVTIGANGLFQDVAPSTPCGHVTGIDGEHGGITVQLYPYDDTPNPGGVYKVWLTPYDALDCKAAGNKHCFVPGNSKTDNYKVKATATVEIDTRFHRNGDLVDGLAATWTDTLGASNVKYSEYAPSRLAFHEAHVEAVEEGTHTISVADQTGCTIGKVLTPNGNTVKPNKGRVSVSVSVAPYSSGADTTYFVDVYCIN
ncbi:hypothetical protein [Nocardioides sp. LS1]|uniref:hypothetical protein n=1 Tax=Nocardioides sp. LS1 TaxID=1027620 RepID=UPI000F61C22D|nr:hypothetical protein [Nocardioides sp. LS1]GCD88348.1 hypothetical protein NLS1_03540 [Nocardioides sp. LS1]